MAGTEFTALERFAPLAMMIAGGLVSAYSLGLLHYVRNNTECFVSSQDNGRHSNTPECDRPTTAAAATDLPTTPPASLRGARQRDAAIHLWPARK